MVEMLKNLEISDDKVLFNKVSWTIENMFVSSILSYRAVIFYKCLEITLTDYVHLLGE